VVTAGLGGAKYLDKGKHLEVKYDKMFEQNKKIQVEGLGSLAYYPNRDSLRYLDIYDVPDIKTFLRATLRYPAFCKGWNAVIALGLTSQNDSFETAGLTFAGWIGEKTGYKGNGILAHHVAQKLGLEADDKVMSMLNWLGIFDERAIGTGKKSSADIMLDILQAKWTMAPGDKDMVVMQHEIEYTHKGNKIKLTSTMVVEGDNREHSAMAKTVGLPIAILTRLVLGGKIKPPVGVLLPNMTSVYRPVLTELAHYGITFKEEVS
jgi:saccharopine dehydrogenase-like NADP-dependent oxidoreductase